MPVLTTSNLVPPTYSTPFKAAVFWVLFCHTHTTWSSPVQPNFQESQPKYCGAAPATWPMMSQPPTYRCCSPPKAYRSGAPKT